MNCDNIIIDGKLYNYIIYPCNLHIENSYSVRKKYFASTLSWIEERHDSEVWKRSKNSLKREWATHNLCYALDIKRDQTKDVDLNYPQKWYVRLGYAIIGSIALLLIK